MDHITPQPSASEDGNATRSERSGVAVRGIVKVYGQNRALDDVALDVRVGEIHGLLGANGAGKSTLVKILAGAVQPDAGEVLLGGEKREFASIPDAEAAGLRIVHQEIMVVRSLTVGENLVLGIHKRADRRQMLRTGQELLKEWELPLALTDRVKDLPPALQATVPLVRALARPNRVLILDEPTVSLGPREVAGLFRIVRRRAREGSAVIFVSHRLAEVAELCDHITVLRNGRNVYEGPIAGTSESDLSDLIVTGEIRHGEQPVHAVVVANPRERAHAAEQPVLEVRNLQLRTRVHDVSLTVERGEIVGIAGLVGSARTETLQALVGMAPRVSGTVLLNGRPFAPSSPYEAMKAGVVYVPEERAAQALFLRADVGFNMSASRFRRQGIGPGGFIAAPKRYDATSSELGRQLSLKAESLRAGIDSLSGGNQQKVVIGRSMIDGLKLLLLDEPTRGVDVGARREFSRIVRDLADAGVAVVYVSSEFAELEQCDRLVVMVEGRTTGSAPAGPDFDEEELTRRVFLPMRDESMKEADR